MHSPPNTKPTAQRALLLRHVDRLRALETATDTDLLIYQNQALVALLNHAYRYSPFWRHRLGKAAYQVAQTPGHEWSQPAQPARITSDNVRALLDAMPILGREDLQQQFEQMRARPPEMAPERIITSSSSGSTGTPVQVEKDQPVYGLFYAATSWIESQWHQRDPRQKIAVTRMDQATANSGSWGGAFEAMGYRGASVSQGLLQGSIADHLDWLLAEQPTYLKCTASVAAELADLALQRGDALQLEQILSLSEPVSRQQRALVKQAFGASIADRYSCEEIGWLAIQCRSQQHLHVTSGTVLLEILDDNNLPCPSGVPGRVVVTSLHSFAMPIIRYELGDIAEWGEPCSCGVTWPVIDALRGRIRRRIRFADGSTGVMPFLGDELGALPAIRQFRIIQQTDLSLTLQVITPTQLTDAELDRIRDIFRDNGLGALPLTVTRVERIDWPAGRKREEFVAV